MSSIMKQDWIECCFEDLLDYEQPTKYIVKSTKYNDSYKMPVLTAGKTFIKGYTNETDGIFENLPTIIFDDFTTATQYVNFKFKVKSSAMKILVPTSKLVNMPLVYYAMQVNQVRNDTHKRYWISVFSKKKFLLPPLVEQKAIVKKIEELFSSLDSGIADLKKAQDQLVIYRQAVLKKAFDLNLKGHRIQEICKEIFAGGDKPKDFFSKTKTKELSIPILANAVANNGLYGYTKTARVNELAITIAGRGSGTGHVELRDEPFVPIVRLITLIPNLEKVVPKYLMYFLKNLNIKGTGSAIPQLTIPTVKSYVINLPSLEKQNQIIQEIESRLSVCDKVEKDIAESLQKAQALRQSILKKAFEGKLLNEGDIAKCKADKDYEPASVLLEKIKAEKSGKPLKTKKPKKKPSAPQKVSTDVQAGVIAKVIKLHEDNPEYLHNLSHVKCEKISHLVECHLQIPLGRVPVKDAAGPDDFPHLKKVEKRARMTGYFTIIKKEIGYSYIAGRNIAKAIDNFEKKISTEQKEQVDNLIKLFLNFDLESAEIIATLYAGWNNLLIDGKTPSDEEIVVESRENWSKRKLTIQRERFFKALQWMRKEEVSLIPTGFGVQVLKKGE